MLQSARKIKKKIFQGRTPTTFRHFQPYPRHPFAVLQLITYALTCKTFGYVSNVAIFAGPRYAKMLLNHLII